MKSMKDYDVAISSILAESKFTLDDTGYKLVETTVERARGLIYYYGMDKALTFESNDSYLNYWLEEIKGY